MKISFDKLAPASLDAHSAPRVGRNRPKAVSNNIVLEELTDNTNAPSQDLLPHLASRR